MLRGLDVGCAGREVEVEEDLGDPLRAQLDELAALRALGVTEVFLDLNFSPGMTAADAERVLEAFAPTRLRPSA